MGCSTSKVDDTEAVLLCGERLSFLDQAIHQRYALAEAHYSYIDSLDKIGGSLHKFIDQDFTTSSAAHPHTHYQKKALDDGGGGNNNNDDLKKKQLHQHHLSHSNSGSHLNFHSDDDDDDDDDELGSLHHSDHFSPLHDTEFQHGDGGGGEQQLQDYDSFPGFMNMNYMKNKATTPSVVYQQRPTNAETVYMGESSSSYSNNDPYYPYYPGYGNDINYNNGGYGGYNEKMPNYGSGSSSSPPPPLPSTKPPPPPPSPPRVSAWDFLNFFGGDDNHSSNINYGYTPSRNSKDVREEEGIPDLEDEYQHEVVKEIDGDHRYFGGDGGGKIKSSGIGIGNGNRNSKGVVLNDGVGVDGIEGYEARPSGAMESDGLAYDVHVVDNKVVDKEERAEEGRGYKNLANVFEVVKEIEFQFKRASESGKEIAKLLEVGKLPYNRKHGVYQVSSKMLNLYAVTPSIPLVSSQPSSSNGAGSSSATDKAGPAQLVMDEDADLRSRNLSSTLQKLYLWEKKLYTEVKNEEKMRVDHDRRVSKLKRLDDRGAEHHKVDTIQTLIRSLSTKIRISIQVVDKISVTINKIRDEELWPQLNALIQGLARMWKCMLECHRSQCQAIREAKSLGSIGSGKNLGDAHINATLEFERELIKWTSTFSSWISAQKGYVRALNSWLLKCLYYEPEVTDDGVVPFSPSRVGAPPVFVICNQWSQALEGISEKEVVDSMHAFTKNVLHIWDQGKLELRQKMMANKDLERKVKNLDRDDQKIKKEIHALDKKMVLVSGDGNNLSVAGQVVYPSDTTSKFSLQESLQRIFEAMEKFTTSSTRAYEQLLQRCEEELHRAE